MRVVREPPAGVAALPLQRPKTAPIDIGVVFFLALALRLVGLGHASLWLDEILGTLQVASSWSSSWAALRADQVHPPLWGLLDHAGLVLTRSEPARRLLPIALGSASVALFAAWVGRRFGRGSGFVTGVLLALSPIHVRYSQELRPYALGLLAVAIALWVSDRLGRQRARVAAAALALALGGVAWSLYLGLTAIPALLLMAWWSLRAAPPARRWAVLAPGVLGGFALTLPWAAVATSAATKTHELEASTWTLDLVARRWQFLTTGGVEGEALQVGALLALALVATGALEAARTLQGWVLLTGALGGTLGAECLLLLSDHWSNARYDLIGLPFLLALAALGAVRVGTALARRVQLEWLTRWRWTGTFSVVALLALAQVSGLVRYWNAGRPDWWSVAADAVAASPGGEWILVGNEWTRISLGYYVARLEGGEEASISPRVRAVPIWEEALALARTSSCGVVVAASSPEPEWLATIFAATPVRRTYPRTAARLAVLPVDAAALGERPWSCSPGGDWLLRGAERPGPFSAAEPSRPRLPARLEMDGKEDRYLGAGWLSPERTVDRETTFRWATAAWSTLQLPPGARSIRTRLWTQRSGLRMTAFRYREAIFQRPLDPGWNEIEIPIAVSSTPSEWSSLDLHFEGVEFPQLQPGARAASFDWIELLP